MKKAVTLIELLIAMFLLTAIVLGIIAFDVASRTFLRSSERKVEVINNLTFVLEHVDKNVLMAVGDSTSDDTKSIRVDRNTPVAGAFTIQMRQDINPDEIDPRESGYLNKTPDVYSDDRWVTYIFDTTTNNITFRVFNSNGDLPGARLTYEEVLVNNSLMNTSSFITSMGNLNIDESGFGLVIENLVLIYKADRGFDAQDNPEAIITEQFFFPLSQSTN